VTSGVGRAATGAVVWLAAALALCGCGTLRQAAWQATPLPVDLSVYVDARAVSVSPRVIAAGPVRLLIASQAPAAIVLELARHRARAVALGGTLQPGGTDQLSAFLRRGVYRIVALPHAAMSLRAAAHSPIAPTWLLVGPTRAGAGNALLAP
jgi:hypothetical protein